MLQSEACDGAALAGEHVLFFVVQSHRQLAVAPDWRTAFPHLVSSAV
jgi:hypothetical protein